MKTKKLIVLLVFFCLSCKNNREENPKKGFDTALWKVKDADNNYSYRDEMLEDLVYRVKLKGLTKEDVIKMLGEPESTNENYLYYEVLAEKLGFFPLHKKFLVLKLTKDNTIEWRKIKN